MPFPNFTINNLDQLKLKKPYT